MVRAVALFGAAIVVLALGCPGAQAAAVTKTKAHPARVTAIHAEAAHRVGVHREVSRATAKAAPVTALKMPSSGVPAPAIDTSAGAPTSLAYRVPPSTGDASGETGPQPPPVLSDQESEASQMAAARGDRDFLMVDKARGKIILLEKSQPVFAGPALTGASLADRLPPGELTEKFDNLNARKTKVTPAGRFTVERGYDKELGGPLLDVSEIRGKDWGIAIHQVYLGTPSEHRDARIKSPTIEDKHISFGCINVTRAAIQYLLRELPESGPFPLYVLPEDPSRTAAYFAPRTS